MVDLALNFVQHFAALDQFPSIFSSALSKPGMENQDALVDFAVEMAERIETILAATCEVAAVLEEVVRGEVVVLTNPLAYKSPSAEKLSKDHLHHQASFY